MALLFCSEIDPAQPWRAALAKAFPQLAFRCWPEIGDREDIRYALVWKPPQGLLASLPNLRAILVLGAGVDAIFEDSSTPRQMPIVRLVDAGLRGQMTEFGLYAVLHFHRDMPHYQGAQRQGRWIPLAPVPAAQRRVGLMGLGVLGADLARALVALGFQVLGWSRTRRHLESVRCFAGADEWESFLAQSDILVNLLPLTSETRGLLNARAFAALPRAAAVINLARGAHLIEDDLLAALDRGHIRGAILDVFEHEPLPADHPFWQHPKILFTPHVAAQTAAELAEGQVIENLRRIEAGETPIGLVDPLRGY